MKEFIDKLISRLNEEMPIYASGWRKDMNNIVNQLAESYHIHCEQEYMRGYADAKNQFAEEYKVSEMPTGWIPCSERLPEEPFGCLVTVMDCEPMTQTDFENILPYYVGYDGETWNDADGNVIPFEVLAWQPLPAPFKEGE